MPCGREEACSGGGAAAADALRDVRFSCSPDARLEEEAEEPVAPGAALGVEVAAVLAALAALRRPREEIFREGSRKPPGTRTSEQRRLQASKLCLCPPSSSEAVSSVHAFLGSLVLSDCTLLLKVSMALCASEADTEEAEWLEAEAEAPSRLSSEGAEGLWILRPLVLWTLEPMLEVSGEASLQGER